MDWRSVKFDWNNARAFLVTAEEGSLSAAARALGLTQPTLGRQVNALEEELGVALFERVGKGFELTPSGEELLKHVRAMGEAAGSLTLTASGQSESIEGTIGISTTDLVSVFVMPSIVEKLRRQHPGIRVELIVTNSESDLKRREADIAIRGNQVSQLDLIARKIGDITVHLYASKDYAKQLGTVASASDLKDASFISDSSDTVLNILNGFGFDLSDNTFSIASDSVVTQWQMVKNGMGIALFPDQLALKESQFEKLLPDLLIYQAPLWLVVHRELRSNRRVRTVYDFLVAELITWFD